MNNLSGEGGEVDLGLYALLESRIDRLDAVIRTREGGKAANSWVLCNVHETCGSKWERRWESYTDWTFFLLALLPSGTRILSAESLGRFEPEAPI